MYLPVEFPFRLSDHNDWVVVKAWCDMIDGDEVVGLHFKFLDMHTSEVIKDVEYDKDTFEMIEEEAIETLIDAHNNRDVYSHIVRH